MLIGVAASAVVVSTASIGLAAELSPQEAKKIAIDAYIYGYALTTSDVTEKAFINTVAPNPETFQAPLNQFVSLPKYPPADYHGVTAPNADTLYSAAFLDVSKEPIILSYPDMHGRYFLFPIYSQWTNVLAAPGSRTLGTGAQIIAITGPEWHHAGGQVSDQFRLHYRARLRRRDAGRLRHGECCAEGVQARPAEFLWQAVHPAGRNNRPQGTEC